MSRSDHVSPLKYQKANAERIRGEMYGKPRKHHKSVSGVSPRVAVLTVMREESRSPEAYDPWLSGMLSDLSGMDCESVSDGMGFMVDSPDEVDWRDSCEYCRMCGMCVSCRTCMCGR